MAVQQTPSGLFVPAASYNVEAYDPGGSLTWLKRLSNKLAWRNDRIALFDNYYRGHHRLQFASPKFRTAFGNLFSEFADNWTPLVIDAVTERLNPQGFRIGIDSEKGDKDAWYTWQANSMDQQIKMGFTESVMREESYILTWYNPDGGVFSKGPMAGELVPEMTVEDPSQMIVIYSNENRRRIAAGGKFFNDDDGFPCATIYLPDGIYKYKSMTTDYRANELYQNQIEWLRDRPAGGGSANISNPNAFIGNPTAITPYSGQNRVWSPRETAGDPWPLPNPLNRVPISVLPNKPRLMGSPESEIHNVIPMQDAANKFLLDLLLASEFAAFQQRWATGVEVPKNPLTGEDMPFAVGPGSMLRSKNNDAKFGAFAEMTGDVHIKAITTVVQHIASQTRTPPHYFYLSGHFPSGEAIKSAETGLVAKVRDKMVILGEGLEDSARMAFGVVGDKRAKEVASETIWRDPESRTEAEHVDATVKRIALGVPLRQLQEDVGYTESQIARFSKMRQEEITQWVMAQAYALQQMAANGIPQPAASAGAPGSAGAGGAGQQAVGPPTGLTNPSQSGAKDDLINSPGSPVALDLRAPRQSA